MRPFPAGLGFFAAFAFAAFAFAAFAIDAFAALSFCLRAFFSSRCHLRLSFSSVASRFFCTFSALVRTLA